VSERDVETILSPLGHISQAICLCRVLILTTKVWRDAM